MSFEYGKAALNLEMTDRIPRTEFSADFHWDLVKKVTGIEVDEHSDAQVQKIASATFCRA